MAKYWKQLYQSDFSAGADSWTATAGAIAGNIDSIGGQNDNLRFTVDATSGLHWIDQSGTFVAGSLCEISYDYYIPSGQSNIDGIRAQDGAAYLHATEDTTDSWTSVSVNWTFQGTVLRILAYDGASNSFQDAGGDDVFYIRNVQILQAKNISNINL